MAHIFPPKAFKPQELPDPTALDSVITPIAEKIWGKINEQDINAVTTGTFPLSVIDPLSGTGSDEGAYTSKHLKFKEVSPGFGATTANPPWFNANVNMAVIDYSQAWQLVADLTKDIKTGEDVLWVVAQMTYACWKGGISGGVLEYPDNATQDPVRVQFAIRVDGAVIDETITGSVIFPDQSRQMLYKAKSTAATTYFDYRHIRYVQNTEGIGGAAKPVRLTYAIPVVEGTHTIEIVARRLPQGDGLVDNNTSGLFTTDRLGSTVAVFNRQMFVLKCNAWGGGVLLNPSSGITTFNEGQVLSNQSLYVDRLDSIQDRMNAIVPGNTERGALRAEVLPDAVRVRDVEVIQNTDYSTTQQYQVYGDNAGWTIVQDASANLLVLDNGGSGWNLSTYSGWFIVMANVAMKNARRTGLTAGTRSQVMGCFTIRVKPAGGNAVNIDRSEVYCTNDNFAYTFNASIGLTPKETTNPCYEDVPLFLAIRTDTLSVAIGSTSVERVEICFNGWHGTSGGSAANIEVTVNGGNASAWIQER